MSSSTTPQSSAATPAGLAPMSTWGWGHAPLETWGWGHAPLDTWGWGHAPLDI